MTGAAAGGRPAVGEDTSPAVLVKLGGSLITRKGGDRDAREEVIRRLAAELAETRDATEERVVLGHGSGSFGHPPAADHGLREGADTAAERLGLSRTQDRAGRLHRLVVGALLEEGVPTFSVVPSSAAVAEDGRVAAFAGEALVRALEEGYLPVLYGDVMIDRRRGGTIASTESVLLRAAEELTSAGRVVRRALWLGSTAGVYGRGGRPLPVLESADGGVPDGVGGSAETDVTGGMRHRVEAALRLASRGVGSWIGDGREPGALSRALRGEPAGGTRIPPASAG